MTTTSTVVLRKVPDSSARRAFVNGDEYRIVHWATGTWHVERVEDHQNVRVASVGTLNEVRASIAFDQMRAERRCA